MKNVIPPRLSRYFFSLPILAAFCALSPDAADAAVVANFTGGNGTTLVDQYAGKAGDGWSAGWNFRSGSGGTTNITVLNTNPIKSGGNYLQVDYSRTTTGGSNRAGVARPFEMSGPGSIDLSKKYTISFDFRPDILTGWTSINDQIVFSSESTTTIGAPGVNSPWSVVVREDGWIVANGNGTGGITNVNLLDSPALAGLGKIAAGAVYNILVEVDPSVFKYDLVITTGGVAYRASVGNGGNLFGFRTNSTANTANVLQFRAFSPDAGDRIAFSLDNVAVIPEPSSVALAIGGIVGFGLTSRKFRLPLGK